MTTLTIEEQEKSLSKFKKKRRGKVVKLVLCNPFENFWPEIQTENLRKIENLLSSLLISENQKSKIPWKHLVKLPKAIRNEQIKVLNQTSEVSDDLLRQRKCLIFGINSVSRAIQHSKISSCLLAGDVKPDIIIKHLITLAVTRGISVLVVSKMRTITNKIVGFPCSALGIKVNEIDGYYEPLNDLIIELSRQFRLPKNYCYLHKINTNINKKNECGRKHVVSKCNKLTVLPDINAFASHSLNLMSEARDFIPLDPSKTIDTIANNFMDKCIINHTYKPLNLKVRTNVKKEKQPKTRNKSYKNIFI